MRPTSKTLRNALILGAPSLLFAQIASATVVRHVPSDQAQGIAGEAVRVDVAPGVGLNISFIQTGELVKKAWIDDPSRITLSFDGTLCQSNSQGQECSSDGGATVVHLRQIRPIQFPDLPRSSANGTLLTLITEGSEGRKLYQFRVRPVAREPGYTTLAVRPTVERSLSERESIQTAIASTQTNAVIASEQPTDRLASSQFDDSPVEINISENPLAATVSKEPRRDRAQPIVVSPPLPTIPSLLPESRKALASNTTPISEPETVQEWAQGLSSSGYLQQI